MSKILRTIKSPQLPCIGCLCLAICKNKKHIECSLLWSEIHFGKDLFEILRPFFPKLESVVNSQAGVSVTDEPPYYRKWTPS